MIEGERMKKVLVVFLMLATNIALGADPTYVIRAGACLAAESEACPDECNVDGFTVQAGEKCCSSVPPQE